MESVLLSLRLIDLNHVAVIGNRGEMYSFLALYDLHPTPELTKKSEIIKTKAEFICDGMTTITLAGTKCIAVSMCYE